MRLLSRHLLSPYFFTFFALMGLPSLQGQTIIPAGFGAMSVTQPSRETAVLTGMLNSTGGQNPTVKIRWGDEDRGTAVTPSTAWDNEVTISTNQAAGTFSTTITIPTWKRFIISGQLLPILVARWSAVAWVCFSPPPPWAWLICRAGGISTVKMPTIPPVPAATEPPKSCFLSPNSSDMKLVAGCQ